MNKIDPVIIIDNNLKYVKADKSLHFDKLKNKDILNRYDHLCVKYNILKNRISSLKKSYEIYLFNDISVLLKQPETLYNLLENEIKILKIIYKKGELNTLMDNIKTFKNFLENWVKLYANYIQKFIN